MGALLNLIRSALTKVGPKLGPVADKIGKLTRTKVQPTVASITNTVKQYVNGNPGKAALAISALSSVGVDFATDSLDNLFSEGGELGGDETAVAILSQLAAERAKLTGDGDEDTLHGEDAEDVIRYVRRQNVINNVIQEGVRAAGNLEFLMAIRAAVQLEDTDFELYREGRNTFNRF